MKRNIITIAIAGIILAIAGTTGAVAGALVTSAQIQDGTIRAVDLRPGLLDRLDNRTNGTSDGVNTNWVAKDGASIVDAKTVTVSNPGTPFGSSVEIQNLNLPVQAGQTIEFTYGLADGAAYGGGSPRVFIETQGAYFNTFDGAPADAGVDNGNGTFTKTVTIPANGRVGQAGIVSDAGVGTVTVTNLVIAGQAVNFS